MRWHRRGSGPRGRELLGPGRSRRRGLEGSWARGLVGSRGGVRSVRPGGPPIVAGRVPEGRRRPCGGAQPASDRRAGCRSGRAVPCVVGGRSGLGAGSCGSGPRCAGADHGLDNLGARRDPCSGDRIGNRPGPDSPTCRRSGGRAARGHGRQALTALAASHGPPRRRRQARRCGRAGVRRREGERRRDRLDQGRAGASGRGHRDECWDGSQRRGLDAWCRPWHARRGGPALPAVRGDGSPTAGAPAACVVAADRPAGGHYGTRWRRPEDTS